MTPRSSASEIPEDVGRPIWELPFTIARGIFAGFFDGDIFREWKMGRNTHEIAMVRFGDRTLEPDIERRLIIIRAAARASQSEARQ